MDKQERAERALDELKRIKTNHYTPEAKTVVIDKMIKIAKKRLEEAEQNQSDKGNNIS